MDKKFLKVKYACYTANISMSIVSSLSPVLFLIFRTLYGISYSKLGLLVLVSFVTQLGVDLVFSFFSHKFNIPKVLSVNPIITAVGLLIYSVWPWIFPNNVYIGLVIGTFIFSAASGLNEVLISPTIAALPSPDPDREMSKLHSVFAWGVVAIIIFCTLFLLIFGQERWQWLGIIFIVIPLASFILFSTSEIPKMETPEKVSGAVALLKNKGVWLSVAAIFLGGASECTMSQWSSSYLEQALSIPKIWGDIFGVAMFSVMLGLGRTLYAKIGKNI
ncbi:MAG: MFS transporter, partial [Clostridia bacterium]|nr:MFS transporter [Clostridia bacterium]